jgi:hypothetical protein
MKLFPILNFQKEYTLTKEEICNRIDTFVSNSEGYEGWWADDKFYLTTTLSPRFNMNAPVDIYLSIVQKDLSNILIYNCELNKSMKIFAIIIYSILGLIELIITYIVIRDKTFYWAIIFPVFMFFLIKFNIHFRFWWSSTKFKYEIIKILK